MLVTITLDTIENVKLKVEERKSSVFSAKVGFSREGVGGLERFGGLLKKF